MPVPFSLSLLTGKNRNIKKAREYLTLTRFKRIITTREGEISLDEENHGTGTQPKMGKYQNCMSLMPASRCSLPQRNGCLVMQSLPVHLAYYRRLRLVVT
jgi:hypothetical protein